MSVKKPVLIAPSILSADFSRLGAEVEAVDRAGADVIHLDVMDGHFVPNITFGPAVINSIRKYSSLPFDAHLMITNPNEYISSFAAAGVNYLTVQAEVCTHLQRTLAEIRKNGMKAGAALNPHTPPDILQYVLDDLDLILVMTVNPGFGGQVFLNSMIQKITQVRKMIDKNRHKILLEVDGGINPKTSKMVIDAGADLLVAGTAVFGTSNYSEAVNALKGEWILN